MLQVMPSVDAAEHIHEHLRRIYNAGPRTLFIRYERKEDIGGVHRLSDGTSVRWTDNTPAWAVHHAAFENKRWAPQQFNDFIESLPVRMFEAPRPSIRDAGYYVAHLLAVKDSPASTADLPHGDRLVRFIRNVHPMNHFYVPNRPRGMGRRYGEDLDVIAFIAAEYEKRFAPIWQEFIGMSRGQSLRGHVGAGAMKVSFRGRRERSVDVAYSREEVPTVSEKSPLATMMCTLITQAELCTPFRRWCGDDKKGRYKHSAPVRLLESPLRLALHWRCSPGSPTKLVGYYRLNLSELLRQGYIRTDTKPGEVRLQFVHEGDAIYIGIHASQRLRVGDFT
jgi:hypothetical protein